MEGGVEYRSNQYAKLEKWVRGRKLGDMVGQVTHSIAIKGSLLFDFSRCTVAYTIGHF